MRELIPSKFVATWLAQKMELLALTYVIVLRAANVSLPPFLKTWVSYSLDYLDELHVTLSSQVVGTNPDMLAKILRATHDFNALARAVPMLHDAWRRLLRRSGTVSQQVLDVLHKLQKREEMSTSWRL